MTNLSAASAMLVCVSHSPIIMIRARAPREEPEILAFYARCRARIEAFDPQLVVVLAPDHFAGFHYSLMPSFCVGLSASAVDDVGGFAGPLDVPGDLAAAFAAALVKRGFDPAVSHRMRVDHGFSQPLFRLTGALDRYPVMPLFLNGIAPPVFPYGRAVELGDALGEILREVGGRVLLIGSGGLSHHPTRYYPLEGEADPEVAAWQLDGAAGGTMTDAQWFERLQVMHEEGAAMLVDGRRTAQDIRLNESFDRDFVELVARGDLNAVRTWEMDDVIARAGIGAAELNTWLAASAAYRRLDSRGVDESIYVPALEYGIGYGMIVGGGTTSV